MKAPKRKRIYRVMCNLTEEQYKKIQRFAEEHGLSHSEALKKLYLQ